MEDNGLLKFYKKATRGGYLNVEDINLSIVQEDPNDPLRSGTLREVKTRIKQSLDKPLRFEVLTEKRMSSKLGVEKCISTEGIYYKKVNASGGRLNKYLSDAEILLGQIYNKVGVVSAIYIPARYKSNHFLLSNDVERRNIVLAENYLFNKSKTLGEEISTKFLKEDENDEITDFFTLQGKRELIKKRIYDTATYVSDSHIGNTFYKLKHGKVDGILSIDSESSGSNFYQETYNDNSDCDGYYNEFCDERLSRQQMLNEIRNNDKLAQYVDKHAIAEEMGSLDVSEVATDIKQTIGYNINPIYVDYISRSLYEVAETLNLP